MSAAPSCDCCPPSPPSVPSESANPPGLTAIAYRLDIQSGFKRSMLQEIAQYPELLSLTTRADEDPAIAMADAWACALDVLTFYQERIANEGFLRTATQRRSILELARALGYELRPGVAASTELAFTMETAVGAPASVLVPTGTKVQSVPAQDQQAQTFETLADITARSRWNALRVQSTRATLPPGLGQSTLFLLGQNTRLQIGDALLIVGDERRNDNTNEQWDFRRVAGVRVVLPADGSPGGSAGYTVVHLDRPLGSEFPDIEPAQRNARIFALRTRANLFGYNSPDWRTMPLGVRAEYLGMDASQATAPASTTAAEISAYPEWPGFTIAATSGPPPGVAAGTGLQGAYYAGRNFQSFIVEQTDGTVNFQMNYPGPRGPWPPAAVPSQDFSVRWEGWIEAPVDGTYVFTATTDDGVRLWVNGLLVIDNWITEAPHANVSSSMALAARQKYTIRLEFFNHSGPATAILKWQYTDDIGNVTNQDPVPASQLYPSNISAVYLDAVYPKIALQSWVVLSAPGSTEVYAVDALGETAFANFAQSAKVTWLTLDGENLYSGFNRHLRETAVFAGSEELDWTPAPESRLLNGTTLTLTTLEPDLQPGQRLAVSGLVPDTTADSTAVKELRSGAPLDVLIVSADGSSATVRFTSESDDDSSDTDDITLPLLPAAEMVTIQATSVISGVTQIALRESLANPYIPQTVRINANIAPASHGDSRQMRVAPEVLGSGDGSAVFQSFQLKQSPVTYISASTASGTASSLTVKVDDVTWNEVPSLYGTKATARVYTSRISDDAKLTVRFGNGITGARLSSGSENVQAIYRVGIGAAGNLNAGQLSLLLSPRLGLKSVVNPTPAAGGVDPEQLADARRNAPTTVLTLERIVSLGDFEAYASGYPGIGKAQAVWVWNGTEQVVVVTVSGTDGSNLPPAVMTHLQSSMDLVRPPHQTLVLLQGTVRKLPVSARIQVGDGYDFTRVQSAVTGALQQQFSFANRQFGEPLSASELVSVMQEVTGVAYVIFDSVGIAPETSNLTGDPIGANAAQWNGSQTLAAELLILDPNAIQLTEIGA